MDLGTARSIGAVVLRERNHSPHSPLIGFSSPTSRSQRASVARPTSLGIAPRRSFCGQKHIVAF